MEMSEIAFERQWEYGKNVRYIQCCFIYTWKDNVEDFSTSSSIGGRPLCNLWFADAIELQGAAKKNAKNVLKDCWVQVLYTVGKSDPTKANASSTASSHSHLPAMDERKSARWSGQVEVLGIQTNQG